MPRPRGFSSAFAMSLRLSLLLFAIVCYAAVASLALSGRSPEQQVSADAPPLTAEAARALKSPIANTVKSIGQGRTLYGLLGCAGCHGNDGKALIEVVANATDLTNPDVWKNGTEEGLVFRSIRDGAGLAMPPFKMQVSAQEDLWHLVNFVRSLWPEGRRPAVAAAQN
jgi:mono/diheme cytochrome c family protein